MDPSIMKLLEEDEDESMHSGADVEAFTAALNRDIESGTSASQPETSFSHEGNQSASQMYSQWQLSNQTDSNANLSHQNQGQLEDQLSTKVESKEHISSIATQEVNTAQAPSGIHMQYNPMQVDGQGLQVEQKFGQYSQPLASMQMPASGRAHPQIPEQDRMHNPASGSHQTSNIQRLTNNQQPVPAPAPEQAGASTQRQKQIPFGSLLPIILPELDKDKAMQLQTLYTQLRKNEIPKDGFVRHMRTIVGDQMLRLAVVKMQAKSQTPSQPQQQQQRPPAGTAAQFSDAYQYGQLHQTSQPSHPGIVGGPSRGPPLSMQQHKESGHQVVDNHSLNSREVQHVIGSHGMQTNQLSGRSTISVQGFSKQQQEHLHFSQSSFPMYGNQPFTGTNLQLHQGFGSAHGGGTSQVMGNNVPKVERQNSYNDTKSVPGAGMPHMPTTTTHDTSGHWPPIGYVKQEPTDQAPDKQPNAAIFQTQGGVRYSTVPQADQGKGPGISSDGLSEKQNYGTPFSSSMRTTNMATSSSVSSQMDTDTQLGSQSALPASMTAMGVNSKTPPKKPVSGQKKPPDALVSSPPLPTKKQKVSGGFADQSIKHLNDVTAVSGVNLREEEEQLFTLPKDDGRISEASRKAVQEEEDRVILQKIPLQKKLAEIMTKCGLKNLSSDVERCLSLCVEERLRALISSLIRVSKQRVDSEKLKHTTVVNSDVREQILMINQKAREEWEKKQAEADKLRKQNEPENSATVDAEKEKDEARNKSLKVNKEEDDKMRTTAANVAARAAVGGDDMLSKWQLMAQARQKRDGGPETLSSSQMGRDANPKPVTTSTGNVRDSRGIVRKDQPTAMATSGVVRQAGRSQPPPRVAPSIALKDVIAVLEREPQMAKSTLVYRLYDRLHADASAE